MPPQSGSAAVVAPIEPDDPKLAEIVRRLVEALRPQRVYLVGSRARCNAREDSDYDMLLIVDLDREQIHRLEVAGCGARWGVGVPVDVLVMTLTYFERRAMVVATLPATVIREGRLLYAASAYRGRPGMAAAGTFGRCERRFAEFGNRPQGRI